MEREELNKLLDLAISQVEWDKSMEIAAAIEKAKEIVNKYYGLEEKKLEVRTDGTWSKEELKTYKEAIDKDSQTLGVNFDELLDDDYQTLKEKFIKDEELLSLLKPHFYFGTSGQDHEPMIEFDGIQIPWCREKDPTYPTSDYYKVKEWLLNEK